MNLLYAALCTFLVNLPFGYWRWSLRELSVKWFLAIHLPIPLVIAFRFIFNLGFALYTYPVMIASYFLGQWLGGYFRKKKLAKVKTKHIE
ncbi:MAG: hypothetical protein J7L04_05575 [Bacteroidales bacterium]|nr:hypothetical protein [Bacteroidales bacterium]